MRKLLAILLVGFTLPTAAATQKQPNILLLMAEDMSSRVGAFGDPVAVTPNIDTLAAQGVRYTNTFTTAGVCAPSRAAHILGMHQISTGTQHMRTGRLGYFSVPAPEVKAYYGRPVTTPLPTRNWITSSVEPGPAPARLPSGILKTSGIGAAGINSSRFLA